MQWKPVPGAPPVALITLASARMCVLIRTMGFKDRRHLPACLLSIFANPRHIFVVWRWQPQAKQFFEAFYRNLARQHCEYYRHGGERVLFHAPHPSRHTYNNMIILYIQCMLAEPSSHTRGARGQHLHTTGRRR